MVLYVYRLCHLMITLFFEITFHIIDRLPTCDLHWPVAKMRCCQIRNFPSITEEFSLQKIVHNTHILKPANTLLPSSDKKKKYLGTGQRHLIGKKRFSLPCGYKYCCWRHNFTILLHSITCVLYSCAGCLVSICDFSNQTT